MKIIFTVIKEGKDDDVEIISTEDEKIKLIGEIFSNDSSRMILKLISNGTEMTANEIAQQNKMSLTLVRHHLKRLQSAGMVTITKTGKSVKGQEMKYYLATKQSFLITPQEKTSHPILKSFRKLSKFAAIGMAGLVSWMIVRPGANESQMQPIHDSGQTGSFTADTSSADEIDTWSSATEQPSVRAENLDELAVSEAQPEPSPEPSHSGVVDFDLQVDSDFADAGSVSLDRTVYPAPFNLSEAESVEPLIFSIIIPVAVIVGGIVIERILSRMFYKRKQNKPRKVK